MVNLAIKSDDYPIDIMVDKPLEPVAMTVYDSTRYALNLTDGTSENEWQSIIKWPAGNGRVHLGNRHRLFNAVYFHQLHCVQLMEGVLQDRNYDTADLHHVRHCLTYLRHTLMCDADYTLEEQDFMRLDHYSYQKYGVYKGGDTRVCRDWETLYSIGAERVLLPVEPTEGTNQTPTQQTNTQDLTEFPPLTPSGPTRTTRSTRSSTTRMSPYPNTPPAAATPTPTPRKARKKATSSSDPVVDPTQTPTATGNSNTTTDGGISGAQTAPQETPTTVNDHLGDNTQSLTAETREETPPTSTNGNGNTNAGEDSMDVEPPPLPFAQTGLNPTLPQQDNGAISQQTATGTPPLPPLPSAMTVDANNQQTLGNGETAPAPQDTNGATTGTLPSTTPQAAITIQAPVPYPDVHISPHLLYQAISPQSQAIWNSISAPKVLVVVYNGRPTNNGYADIVNIAQLISTALTINESDFTVCRGECATLQRIDYRPAFPYLVYDLSQPQIDTLLSRRVWVTNSNAFFFYRFDHRPMDFVFSLCNYPRPAKNPDSEAIVRSIVMSAMRENIRTIKSYIANNYNNVPLDQRTNAEQATEWVINSTRVTSFFTTNKSNQPSPIFNVYISPPAYDHVGYSRWIEMLGSITYSGPQGVAHIRDPPFHCSLCKSSDHPTGLCEYPQLPNWPIPYNPPVTATTSAPSDIAGTTTTHDAHTNQTRGGRGGGRGRGGRGRGSRVNRGWRGQW
ncbi:hypothetical protein CVT24_006122 [Panaeolus cyanescens]|uniref:Uncharacterized protein n=1 Tax=Panaeolus cyanescens TaxID=181874 RepID=A0A409YDW5_9AGAR|nr:hypothetical protein CVT24_006122 [Panaeolus cyanescens]